MVENGWEKAVEELFLPKNTEVDLEVSGRTKTFSGVNMPSYAKGISRYDEEISHKVYQFVLEVDPETKTFSVKNATHIQIEDEEDRGLINFLRKHSGIFETLEGAISSRECYLVRDQDMPSYYVKMREVFYGHSAYDKRVFYKYGSGFPREDAFEAHMTKKNDSKTYSLNTMFLRYISAPPRGGIETPEFPDLKKSLEESNYHLMGGNNNYRSIKMEEILLYTPQSRYELAQMHTMESELDNTTATLILNKRGIVNFRQIIRFKEKSNNH